MTTARPAESQLFTTENLAAFAAAWYRALDVHAPTETCAALLAPEGLRMIFPEKTLHGLDDFAAWYAGGTYGDGTSSPGVINLFFDENHTVLSATHQADEEGVTMDVLVGWQASWFTPPAAKSQRLSLNASQRWAVRPAPEGRNRFGVVVASYEAAVEPFVYAPGFARL